MSYDNANIGVSDLDLNEMFHIVWLGNEHRR